jgi:hypothetical protein
MYNTRILKIEVKVPGRAKIPNDYKKLAIRYNNSNVASNPFFNYYFEDSEKLVEKTNTDSIASEIYFQLFTEQLKKQQFFDTIIELKPVDFSDIALSDSLIYKKMVSNDSNQVEIYSGVNSEVYNFSRFVKKYSSADSNKNVILLIDPEYGLYTQRQIQNIAGSTGADLFLSLDFFSSIDGIFSPDYIGSDSISIFNEYLYDSRIAREIVYTLACWNIYDLKKVNFERTLQKLDTIQWMEPVYSLKEAKRMLPPRKDAVLNAADIAGSRFAEFLVPHWIEVDRMYYRSGHTELKATDELIAQNQWLEAAKIWKKNTTNTNKSIAAKSMFNMALACEMSGEMDAALDWAIKSFYVFGNKNPEHAFNCQEYIRILAQRKLDIQKIDGVQ